MATPTMATPTMIFILNLLLFNPILNNGFCFDDRPAILENRDVQDPSWTWKIFHHDFWGENLTEANSHKSYRPLTVMTFKLNRLVSSGNVTPWSFHIVNLLLHAVNATLVYLYVRQISRKTAVWTAWLFSVHPVHGEAVAGIVGRADLLCFFFVILGLIFNQRSCSLAIKWIGLLVFSALATLCKEQGVVLIPLALIHDMIIIHRFRVTGFGFKLREKVLLIVKAFIGTTFTALILWIRLWIMDFTPPKFQEGDNPAAFVTNPWLRIINFHYIYALNGFLLLVPDWLCHDWSMGCVRLIRNYQDPRTLGIIALWIIIIFLLRQVNLKLIVVALSWLVIPFLPSSNLLVTVGFVMAERNLYMSSMAVALLVPQGMRRLKRKKLMTSMAIFLMICHGFKSRWRAMEWKNEEILFKSGLKVCPSNAKIHYNLAKLSADLGNVRLAETLYRHSIDLWPRYEHALNNLGNLLRKNRRGPEDEWAKEARTLFLTALEVNPKFAAAWMNLGIVEAHLGLYESAFNSYKKALSLRKIYPDAHYNLGTLNLKVGLKLEALEQFRLALSQHPQHFSAMTNTVILLDELERFEEAEEMAMKGTKTFPEKSEFYFHLANVYGKTSKYDRAETFFLEAVRLEPSKPLYHLNLGVLYHRWKKYQKAEASYLKLLELDPDHAKVRKYLEMVRQSLKR